VTGTITEIVRAFGVAEREMKKKLGAIDVGSFSEIKASQTQKDLNVLFDGLNRYAARWARAALAGRYADSQARARTRLEMIGAERNKGFDKERHHRAIDRSLDATLKDFLKATGAMRLFVGRYIEGMRKYSGSLLQVQEFANGIFGEMFDEFVWDLVQRAIKEHQTRSTVSREIMTWLRNKLSGGNLIPITGKDGVERLYNIRDYARMVARTRMMQAAAEATKNECREYDNDLVVWSTHAEPCSRCEELEGQVFSISGTNPKHPMLTDDTTPPLHPNCGHNIAPTSEIAIDYARRRTA